MLIATILLIANLVALVFAEPFMSFWWNAVIYGIEILFYIVIVFIIIIIASVLSR